MVKLYHRRCDTEVTFEEVTPGYFAVCLECYEDLYQFETYQKLRGTMDNISIDDMRGCLVDCFKVEEEYLIPALYVADGDPEKLEKVLTFFSGDRHTKFTDPTIPHCENCSVAYELRPRKFTLTMELGNKAMKSGTDLGDALTQLATRMGYIEYSNKIGHIEDRHGYAVGKWELS